MLDYKEVTTGLIVLEDSEKGVGSIKFFPTTRYHVIEVLGEICPIMLKNRDACYHMAQAMYLEKKQALKEGREGVLMFPDAAEIQARFYGVMKKK